MKSFLYIVLGTFMFFSCGNNTKSKNEPVNTNKTTTVYLVRHAEKDLNTLNDPTLTTQGEKRANNLATYFKNKNIAAVYATNFNRTKATATPTAQANGLEIIDYSPGSIDKKNLTNNYAGQSILIVGHSNTIPQLADKLAGTNQFEDIPDTVYNRIYKVEIFENGQATATMTTLN